MYEVNVISLDIIIHWVSCEVFEMFIKNGQHEVIVKVKKCQLLPDQTQNSNIDNNEQ